MAAIFTSMVKYRTDHVCNIKYEFHDSKNPTKHILYNTVGQTTEKVIFTIADSG